MFSTDPRRHGRNFVSSDRAEQREFLGMSGEWRISEDEEIERLREARRIARLERTAEAWARVEAQVARCKHLGVPEDRWLVDR
jgi:hypothetical protein